MCSQFASVPWSSSADPASNVACSFISGAGEAVRGRALQTPGVFPSTGGLLSTSPGSQGLAPEPGRPLSGMAGPEPLPGRQGSGWSALMAPAPGTAPGPQRGRSAVCPSSDVKPGFYSGKCLVEGESVPLPKNSCPLRPQDVTYLEVGSVRTSRGSHPGVRRTLSCPIRRGEDTETPGKWPCDDGGEAGGMRP